MSRMSARSVKWALGWLGSCSLSFGGAGQRLGCLAGGGAVGILSLRAKIGAGASK